MFGCDAPNAVPAPAQVDVDVLTDIRVALENDEEKSVSLALELNGEQIPSARVVDGASLVLIPLVALGPDQNYTVRLERPCGSQSWSFTTTRLATTSQPLKRTFALDLIGAVSTPDAVQGVLALMMPSMVAQVGPDHIEIAFLNNDGVQAECEPTVQLVGGGADPSYSFATANQTNGSTLRDVYARGVMQENGELAMSLLIRMDLRFVAYRMLPECETRGLDESSCSAELCSTLGFFGLGCEPCSEDGAPFCMTYALRLTASEQPLEVSRRELSGICANPECSSDEVCR